MMKKVRELRNNLREARFRERKPQARLWLETGIHYSTISRLECGYMRPTEDQKRKLAKALGVDSDWLFPWQGGSPKRNPNPGS